MTAELDRPLRGIVVVDAVRGSLAPITRYLAELGASVHRIGCGALQPEDDEELAANSGKRIHAVAADSAEAIGLLATAHAIVADSTQPIDLLASRKGRPELVTMTTSDFGTGNALSAWRATSPVMHALSGVLSRSGINGREPLIPPGDMAFQCSAAHAAYALVSGLYRALSTGAGAHFDFSALDGAVQALDPGFGISGSATLGKPVGLLLRGRPRPGYQYPIFRCADGYVRICLLSKRQWRGMFAWMGEPEQFASPEFDKTGHRYASRELLPFIAGFFAPRLRADLEAEGQAHGVPISAVMDLPEFMASEHLAAREALRTLADGSKLPGSPFVIDGQRATAAHDFDPALPVPPPSPAGAPFAELKVLDLGIIVVGAEQGRMLADFGADVVKVESQAFPDGNRQSYLDFGMSVSFAAGHRNKRSLGLNLRSDEGRALFLDLVRQADVVCSNFKPGTLEKLGLGYDVLAAANPRIVVSESSAFGDTGPWRGRMGYGPLVRAVTGLTLAWRYPDDPESFSDPLTIYPDHVAGRICAMAAVALLIRRLRTGHGGISRVAQSEVMLCQFAAEVLRSSRSQTPLAPPSGPWGVFPAKGDDEWCVVTVRSAEEREALHSLIGASTEAALREWLGVREPFEAASALQAAGVPAAPMLRLADLPGFVYYRDRGFYREAGHRWLRETVQAEAFVVPSPDLPPPPQVDAPLAGEQTEEVIAQWLGLPTDELVASGVLEPLPTATRDSAERYLAEA